MRGTGKKIIRSRQQVDDSGGKGKRAGMNEKKREREHARKKEGEGEERRGRREVFFYQS